MVREIIKHRRERSKFPRYSYLAMNFKGGGTSSRLWGDENLKGELSKERATLMLKKNLGRILVEKNVITQGQLDLALTRQRLEKGKYLGEILFEMGVPQEEINKTLDFFDKRKPIGQILIDLKSITPQQLEEVLEKQKELRKKGIRKPLGMLMVELGYISYDGSMRALSKYFIMPAVSLEKFIPSLVLQKAVGERYARKQGIVVLQNSANTIKLALSEPKVFIMEELKKALPMGKRIEFYLANPYDVETCLKRKMGASAMTNSILPS